MRYYLRMPPSHGTDCSRVEEAVLQEYSDTNLEMPAARVALEAALIAADSSEAHCTHLVGWRYLYSGLLSFKLRLRVERLNCL